MFSMMSILTPFIAFSENSSLPSENCLIINSENLNLEVPCANFLGNCYSFTLKFNSELAGWQLEPSTFTSCKLDLNGEETDECMLINEENLDLEVSCANYLGGCYSVVLNFDQSLGIGWRLEAESFAPCEQEEPVELIISANGTPANGTVPLTTSFSCTVESGNPSYIYSWNFGDGTASDEQNPTHIYDVAGTYTATVIVVDDKDQRVSKSIDINVNAISLRDYRGSWEGSTSASRKLEFVFGEDTKRNEFMLFFEELPVGYSTTIHGVLIIITEKDFPKVSHVVNGTNINAIFSDDMTATGRIGSTTWSANKK